MTDPAPPSTMGICEDPRPTPPTPTAPSPLNSNGSPSAAAAPTDPNSPAPSSTTAPSTDPDDATALIGEAAMAVIEAVDHLAAVLTHRDHLPLDPAIQTHAAITDARADLNRALSLIETRILHLWREHDLGRRIHAVEGVGAVEVNRGMKRTGWDHEAAAHAVLDASLDKHVSLDGEVPNPWDVLRWVMEAVSPSGWRVTTLKALGLRPGDYCTETPDAPTLRITRTT